MLMENLIFCHNIINTLIAVRFGPPNVVFFNTIQKARLTYFPTIIHPDYSLQLSVLIQNKDIKILLICSISRMKNYQLGPVSTLSGKMYGVETHFMKNLKTGDLYEGRKLSKSNPNNMIGRRLLMGKGFLKDFLSNKLVL